MKKILTAGALALAAAGLLSTPSTTWAGELSGAVSAAQPAAAIDIARIKRKLDLTPEQKAYWPPVEAALRTLARRQTGEEPAGPVERIGHGTLWVMLDADAIRRLAAAARPLIARLSDRQKQVALAMAEEMGLGPVLAAMN
jgi:hypothetical protein